MAGSQPFSRGGKGKVGSLGSIRIHVSCLQKWQRRAQSRSLELFSLTHSSHLLPLTTEVLTCLFPLSLDPLPDLPPSSHSGWVGRVGLGLYWEGGIRTPGEVGPEGHLRGEFPSSAKQTSGQSNDSTNFRLWTGACHGESTRKGRIRGKGNPSHNLSEVKFIELTFHTSYQ